jgi:hypothetical protein
VTAPVGCGLLWYNPTLPAEKAKNPNEIKVKEAEKAK